MVCNFLFHSIFINSEIFLLFLNTCTTENTLKLKPEISKYHISIWLRLLNIQYRLCVTLKRGRVSTSIRHHLLPVLGQANKRIYWVLSLMWRKSFFHLCFVSEVWNSASLGTLTRRNPLSKFRSEENDPAFMVNRETMIASVDIILGKSFSNITQLRKIENSTLTILMIRRQAERVM